MKVVAKVARAGTGTAQGHRRLKTTLTYDGGRTQRYDYDAASRNTGIRDRMAGSDIQRFTYTFDANGNRIGTVDLNGSVTTYTLDANDRLTQDLTVGTDAHTFTYTYDSRGNLLTTSETGVVVAHAYDAASRLVTSTAGGVVTTYTFDVNGNMVSANAGGTVTTHTYDRENRLTSTSTGVNTASFVFGADFHRKQDGRFELYYLDDLIIGEGQRGEVSKLYFQLDGQLVGEVPDMTDLNVARYYLADFLGSVTGEVNTKNNDVENVRRMTPYGRLLSGAAFVNGAPNWVGAHGYRYGNHPFAQVYVWHRVYALQTSQWTTRDPFWPEERAYGYVNGNPVMWVDPSGERLKIVNCEDGIEKRLRRMCTILEGLSSGDRKKIDSCILRTSKVSYQTCQPFNAARLECYKTFCRSGYIDCRKGDGSTYGRCPTFKEPTNSPEKPTGGIILFTPLDASNWTTISGGIHDGREGRITMLHEIAHACGVEHGAYGHASPCQCNDIYACCIFEVGMGRSGEKCVDAMKKYIGAKKPC